MWSLFWFLSLVHGSHQEAVDTLTLKYLEQATKEYVAEEHGEKELFVATSVYMGLHREVEKLLEAAGKKLIPVKDIGTTLEGHLVLAGAKYRERAALFEMGDEREATPFSNDEIECSDVIMHPGAYTGYKKCSPQNKCFRKHVPDFPGASSFKDAFQAQQTPIRLTRKTGETFKAAYEELQDLAVRMREATIKIVKAKGLYFVSASLEDDERPVGVDSTQTVGVDYSAVYLLDGSVRFRSREETREASHGLVIFTSGIENKLELFGKRLHIRLSCNVDFGDESLAAHLPKTPGKGKLTKTALQSVDWRLWFIFLFVLSWMFRF